MVDILALFIFVTCLLASLALFLSGNIYYLGSAANSDLIYIEALYKDIFVDHFPINGWLLSKAPYFFPDWIIFFTLRTLSPYYLLAYALSICINFLLLSGCFYFILRQTLSISKNNAALITCAWSPVFLLLLPASVEGYGPHNVLLPVYHSGALINGLIILTIWLRSMREETSNVLLVTVFFTSIIATISDQWWVIWFGAPIIVTTLLNSYLNELSLIKSIKNKVFLTLLGGIITGLLVTELMKIFGIFFFSDVAIGGNKMATAAFARDIFELHFAQPALAVLFLGMVYFLLSSFKNNFLPVGQLLKNGWADKETQQRQLLCLAIVCVFSYISTSAPIIILSLWEKWNYRYVHNFLYIPWMLVGVYLASKVTPLLLWKKLRPFALLVPFAMSSWIYFNSTDIAKKETFLWNEPFAPQGSVCVDETAETLGLEMGLAQYWNAKPNTYLSRTNTRLNQFDNNLRPLHWMNNLHWFSNNNDFGDKVSLGPILAGGAPGTSQQLSPRSEEISNIRPDFPRDLVWQVNENPVNAFFYQKIPLSDVEGKILTLLFKARVKHGPDLIIGESFGNLYQNIDEPVKIVPTSEKIIKLNRRWKTISLTYDLRQFSKSENNNNELEIILFFTKKVQRFEIELKDFNSFTSLSGLNERPRNVINGIYDYDFVVSHKGNDDMENSLLKNVGPPSFTIPCDYLYVMVYEGEKKRTLNKVIRRNILSYFEENKEKYGVLLSDTFLNRHRQQSAISIGTFKANGDAKAEYSLKSLASAKKDAFSQDISWKVNGESDYSYVFQETRLEIVQNSILTYRFKARVTDGLDKVRGRGLAYIKPSGLLDSSAIPIEASSGSVFEIENKWREFVVNFDFGKLDDSSSKNIAVEVRPIFLEKQSNFNIDIRDLSVSLTNPIDKNIQNELVFERNYGELDALLHKIDAYHANGDFPSEFKMLKLLEKNFNAHKDASWRLARMYISIADRKEDKVLRKANMTKASDILRTALFVNDVADNQGAFPKLLNWEKVLSEKFQKYGYKYDSWFKNYLSKDGK